MRRSVLFLLVTLLTASAGWAQSGRSGRHGGPFGFDLRGPFHGSHHPGFFHHNRGRFFFGAPFFGGGFFAGSRLNVVTPGFFGPRVRLLDGPDLADPDGFHYRAGPRWSGFWGASQGGYVWQHTVPDRNPSWVEEWKDRDPRQEEPAEEAFSFSDSLLLEEGMSREDVMGLLGSPAKRIRLGAREVWRYSGYSLVFEGDALKEMR